MNNLLFVAMLLALLLLSTEAFTTTRTTSERRTSTRLNAWSLPEPPASFSSFKSSPTWYNVVDNPTARQTVYDDTPNEFRFVALGDDWPSVSEWGEESSSSQMDLQSKPRVRLNPIRRAAKWMSSRRKS